MPQPNYEEERMLIWGMTAPELSEKYIETVCTAGVTEKGKSVRLYPIPYRYFNIKSGSRFHKYQWITASIAKSTSDPRPESYKVQPGSIRAGERVMTTQDEWGVRADLVFPDKSWQFDSVDDLLAAQRSRKTSLGVVEPREIVKIGLHHLSDFEAMSFEEKLERLRQRSEIDQQQLKMFEEETAPEFKNLDFVKTRIQIDWKCKSPECQTHKMQILDWELIELTRREGEQKALQKMNDICDLNKYALKFYLGNFRLHPTAFTVVGLWYPKRRDGLLFK